MTSKRFVGLGAVALGMQLQPLSRDEERPLPFVRPADLRIDPARLANSKRILDPKAAPAR